MHHCVNLKKQQKGKKIIANLIVIWIKTLAKLIAESKRLQQPKKIILIQKRKSIKMKIKTRAANKF
jgi:hypothetical protein